MKKIVLLVLILVIVPLYAGDVYLQRWVNARLKQTLHAAIPGTTVDANIGGYFVTFNGRKYVPRPMMPAVLFKSEFPDVTIHLGGHMNIQTLSVDDWYLSADRVAFDATQLFDNKRVAITEIENAKLRLVISDESLGVLDPAVVVDVDASGKATATVGGVRKNLTVETSGALIIFKADGTEFARVDTSSSSLVSCAPNAAFEPNGLRITCEPTEVPKIVAYTAKK